MKLPDVYSASDYAGISTENFSAYYGYEEVGENDEWCFIATIGDTKIKIPFSKLKAKDKFECTDCLLMGIAWILTKYKLTL